MFYSHEVLTQRKYGVATIWLVATLGSKSSLKKVQRKDILSVNVPKACETVIKPDAPLALRLQSNLLYGISRVYSGQCDYLINDASMTHMNIKRMIKSTTIKAANLDLVSGGRTRPEHLVLHDDPEFLPDVNLTMLTEGVDLTIDEGDTVFTYGHVSSLLSSALCTPGPNLMIPTSDTVPGDYGFSVGSPVGEEEEEENRFIEDAGFEFSGDGEMRELGVPKSPKDRGSIASGKIGLVDPSRMKRGESMQSFGRGNRLNSEDIAKRVLLEHREGRDIELSRSHVLDDGDNIYAPPDEYLLNIGAEQFYAGSHQPSIDTTIEKNVAVLRKRSSRNTKFIIDDITEVRSAELKEWRENYLSNMEAATRKSQAWGVGRKAKRNANNILFDIGFFGKLKNPVLKSLFSTETLLDQANGEWRTGIIEGTKKRKRVVGIKEEDESRDIGGEDEGGKRVRTRVVEDLEEMEIGLGNNPDDEYDLPMEQPDEGEIEIGREGPEIASDGIRPSSQTALPWNVMSGHKSRPGSLLMSGGLLPSVGGFPSSSVAGSQIDFTTRRGSRASAIKGGLERLSILGSPIGEREEEVLEELGVEFPEEVDFEYFGAGANVDTQTAQDSQWLAATVEQESTNFFGFLKTEHTKNNQKAEDNGEELVDFITFEELLDPAQNRKIVAAQAFHHTLLLATKGLIYVSQEESYGSIQISIL